MIKCKDGEILDFITEKECRLGCPTCSYGWAYIDRCKIEFTRTILKCKTEYEDDYILSEDFWVKLMCSNAQRFASMTEDEIIEFIIEDVRRACPEWAKNLLSFEILDNERQKINEQGNTEKIDS